MANPVKKAFLVGITDYDSPGGSNLPACKADVALMGEVLQRKGFVCQAWVDQDLAGLLPNGALGHFFADATSPEDTLLFYFGGHGVEIRGLQILQGGGKRPTSWESALKSGQSLLLVEVLNKLAKYPGRKIVIVDACRNRAEEGNHELAVDLQTFRDKLFDQRRLSNCAVIYASAEGTSSWLLPSNDYSRFTVALASEWKQYGRGILATFESAIERVAQINDGKEQIPWIYASLRDRPLDGIEVACQPISQSDFPKHLGVNAAGKVWAVLNGSIALVNWQHGRFIRVARLPEAFPYAVCSFDPHPERDEFAYVKPRSNSVHRLIIGARSHHWHKTKRTESWLSVRTMYEVFGAWWSHDGQYLAAIGAPKADQHGVALWSIEPTRHRRMKVTGLPDGLEMNAAVWVDSDRLLVAGSQDESSVSHVFVLERKGKIWQADLQWITRQPLRITAMAVAKDMDRVYLGADDGSIGFGMLSAMEQPVFHARTHASSGIKSYGGTPWRGKSRHEDYLEMGICSAAFDEGTGVLALCYFDSTVAFLDTVFMTYVTSMALTDGRRRPEIVATVDGTLLCTAGLHGQRFTIVDNSCMAAPESNRPS